MSTLREQIVTAIEDRFVRTLEVRLDEDVPALADEILAIIDKEVTRPLQRDLNEIAGNQYRVGLANGAAEMWDMREP